MKAVGPISACFYGHGSARRFTTILPELVLHDFAAHLRLVFDTTTSSAIPTLVTLLFFNGS
jgi:hypothetical protein